MSKYTGDLWSANFLGGKARDEYNEPFGAEQGWWEGRGRGEEGERGLRDVVEEIFVVAGGDEVLVDSIRIMAGRLEVSFPPPFLSIIYTSLSLSLVMRFIAHVIESGLCGIEDLALFTTHDLFAHTILYLAFPSSPPTII